MSLIRLLYGLNDRLVDSEGDGDTEQGEQQVRHHTDDAERGQRREHQHRASEHQRRLLRLLPIHQTLHCREGWMMEGWKDEGCLLIGPVLDCRERESAVIHLIVCDLTALTPSSSRAAVAHYVMKVQIVSV